MASDTGKKRARGVGIHNMQVEKNFWDGDAAFEEPVDTDFVKSLSLATLYEDGGKWDKDVTPLEKFAKEEKTEIVDKVKAAAHAAEKQRLEDKLVGAKKPVVVGEKHWHERIRAPQDIPSTPTELLETDERLLRVLAESEKYDSWENFYCVEKTKGSTFVYKFETFLRTIHEMYRFECASFEVRNAADFYLVLRIDDPGIFFACLIFRAARVDEKIERRKVFRLDKDFVGDEEKAIQEQIMSTRVSLRSYFYFSCDCEV